MALKYKRIVLKLSGEALGGEDNGGIFDHRKLTETASRIAKAAGSGCQIAVVIGAGNIWRGARQGGLCIDRVRGDHMGMLATVINSLAMQDYLISAGIDTAVMSAVPLGQFCEDYSQYAADDYLNKGRVVILTCGVGMPFFSTDTGMILRACELKADAVLSAKAVDYVYDRDPKIFPDAKKYEKLTFAQMQNENLKVIDSASIALAAENNIKLILFALSDPDNIIRVLNGEAIGTLVTN